MIVLGRMNKDNDEIDFFGYIHTFIIIVILYNEYLIILLLRLNINMNEVKIIISYGFASITLPHEGKKLYNWNIVNLNKNEYFFHWLLITVDI